MNSYQEGFKNFYKRIENYIIGWDLKKIAKNMLILAILVSLAGSYLWYSRMYMTNERRFWLAIENSMATRSVTRTITNGGSGNQVVQDQQFFFTPQMVTRSHVNFSQKSATVDTSVETEGITFADASFSRYTTFRTNQQKDDGSLPSLDSILGKWESSQIDEANLEGAKLNYISELVTLAIFGSYDGGFRRDVIRQLKASDTYRFEPGSIIEDEVEGRRAIIVPVSVGLRSYAGLLQRAFVEAGYGEFPPLNPENYREDSRISAQFAIDLGNNSIIGIQFGGRQEVYSGYGININVQTPKADFSGGELEAFVEQEISSAL